MCSEHNTPNTNTTARWGLSAVGPRDRARPRAAAHCHYPAPGETIVQHTASFGKDQNSKPKVRFPVNVYHFCSTVMSKTSKFNHHKSGPLCTVFHYKFKFYMKLHTNGVCVQKPYWEQGDYDETLVQTSRNWKSKMCYVKCTEQFILRICFLSILSAYLGNIR